MLRAYLSHSQMDGNSATEAAKAHTYQAGDQKQLILCEGESMSAKSCCWFHRVAVIWESQRTMWDI